MKILNVQIPRIVKTLAVASPLLLATQNMKGQSFEIKQDTFEKTKTTNVDKVPDSILEIQPIEIGEEDIYPALVFNLSKGMLRQYDLECYFIDQFKIPYKNNSAFHSPGLKRIDSIDFQSKINQTDSITSDVTVLSIQNIDKKTGEELNAEKVYLLDENYQFPKTVIKPDNYIKLPKESISKLLENLYEDQYLLIEH